MRTDKTERKQGNAARATARTKPAPVVIPETTEPDVAESILAKHDPTWGDISPAKKNEIISGLIEMHNRPERAAVQVVGDGQRGLAPKPGESVSGYYAALSRTFASKSNGFILGQIDTIVTHLLAHGRPSMLDRGLNEILAFVGGCNCQNEMQAKLAVQTALTNDAAMRALKVIGNCEMIDAMRVYGDLATKLLRTSTAQFEALAKLQRGGEQVVRHIHVDNRGGQAVFAETVQTGGQNAGSGHQPYAASESIIGATLPSPDPLGSGVPISSGDREAEMQDARRGQR